LLKRLTQKGELKMSKYNKEAVSKAIKRDPRIKGKEAKLIHSLLKGRRMENDAVVLGKAVTNEEIKAILIDPNIAGKIVRIV
tara:strand:+ start:2690 stop:2935 length:246 start_codon:yes stop_codon:yes gene_type:complete